MALRPREKRLLVLAGVMALVVGGHALVVEPSLSRSQQARERIAAREALLERQQRLLARREAYLAEERALREAIERRRARLLPGDRAPLAASELQKLIKSTAQEAGVEVRSERTLPPAERGGYLEVPVEVTLSGPIRGVVGFLRQLEAAPLLLSIQDVKLRVVSVGAPRDLLATVAVAGYMAAPGAEGRDPRPEGPRRQGG